MELNIFFDPLWISVILFVCVFSISWIGVFLYRKLAIRKDILSNPNFRTLHEQPVPRGGGIIFSLIFVASVFWLWLLNYLSNNLFLVLGVGGCAATLFGFIDDVKDIRASRKLAIQIFLSGWVLFWLNREGLLQVDWLPLFVVTPLFLFFLVWVMNAYNFMDGVDGMAASGAFFVTGTLTLLMLLINGSFELAVLFFVLMSSVGGFMVFNWPPASIFMGDAGSIFLGYIFGSFILITVMNGEISVWTWLIVFGYFFADTTLTQIARVILVKKWYGGHRSHAYQNLARITGSHFKVTAGVVAYHVIWLLPLAFWTVLQSEMEIVAVILAILPSSVLAYKYGPSLSSL